MIQVERQWLFCERLRLHDFGYKKPGLGHRATERPLIMEEQHNLTKKDKFILTTVLLIIFVGILGLGLIGVAFSLLG